MSCLSTEKTWKTDSDFSLTCKLFPVFPGGLDFEAILLKPSQVAEQTKLPLVVSPHGKLLVLFPSLILVLYNVIPSPFI